MREDGSQRDQHPGLFDRIVAPWAASVGDDPDLVLRLRVLLLYSLLTLVMAVGWGFSHLGNGSLWVGGFYLVFSATIALLLLKFLRDGDQRWASRGILTLGVVSTVGATWVTGGLRLTNVTPFFVLLVASIFLLGRGGAPWAIASLVGALGFQVGHWAGYEFLDLVPPHARAMDAFVTWFSMAVMVLLFVWAYESARERTSARMRQADRAKDLFIANISHELRAPLHVLTSVHELLARSSLGSDQRALVELGRQHAGNLGELVDDLLDLASLQRGHFALVEEDFDPVELVDGVGQVLGAWCVERGLAFTMEVEEGAPRWVRGDPRRLRQVLMNLGNNALKFTDLGEVSLVVEVPDPDQPRRVSFSLRDTGIGIAEADQERIFRSFVQVDDSLTRRQQGAGLGLFISAGILAQMEGTLELESALGHGSTFRFEVPFAPAWTPRPARPASATAPSPGLRRILVIEDNADSREVVEALLEALGHQAILAGGGQAGLEQWERQRPDLVLMDVQMPGIDGLTATRMLREREAELGRRPVPVVAMTGHSTEADRRACLEAGMTDTLFKPFTLRELQEALGD